MSNNFWDWLSRIRNAFWAIGIVWQIAAGVLVIVVLIFGYIQSIPVSVLIPATLLTVAGVGALALVVENAARRWIWKQPASAMSERAILLCKLKDEAQALRDAVMTRHDPSLDVDDAAFNTIFHVFPQKLKMYVGADSERDYIATVGIPTRSSENIKVAANIAYATIEQITALTIRHEREQAEGMESAKVISPQQIAKS